MAKIGRLTKKFFTRIPYALFDQDSAWCLEVSAQDVQAQNS